MRLMLKKKKLQRRLRSSRRLTLMIFLSRHPNLMTLTLITSGSQLIRIVERVRMKLRRKSNLWLSKFPRRMLMRRSKLLKISKLLLKRRRKIRPTSRSKRRAAVLSALRPHLSPTLSELRKRNRNLRNLKNFSFRKRISTTRNIRNTIRRKRRQSMKLSQTWYKYPKLEMSTTMKCMVMQTTDLLVKSNI